MTWTDIAPAASTIATIIAAIFTVAAFFKKAPKANRMAQQSTKTPILIVGLLALVSWGAVALDYHERHSKPFAYSAVVHQWGIAAPLNYFLEANGTALADYKSSHKLMLILRVPYAESDRMTDKLIEKSHLYTIAGGSIMLAHPTLGKLRFVPLQPTPVEFNLVLIPNGISEEQVNSLSDVETLGGKLIAATATSIIGGPPDQAITGSIK